MLISRGVLFAISSFSLAGAGSVAGWSFLKGECPLTGGGGCCPSYSAAAEESCLQSPCAAMEGPACATPSSASEIILNAPAAEPAVEPEPETVTESETGIGEAL